MKKKIKKVFNPEYIEKFGFSSMDITTYPTSRKNKKNLISFNSKGDILRYETNKEKSHTEVSFNKFDIGHHPSNLYKFREEDYEHKKTIYYDKIQLQNLDDEEIRLSFKSYELFSYSEKIFDIVESSVSQVVVDSRIFAAKLRGEDFEIFSELFLDTLKPVPIFKDYDFILGNLLSGQENIKEEITNILELGASDILKSPYLKKNKWLLLYSFLREFNFLIAFKDSQSFIFNVLGVTEDESEDLKDSLLKELTINPLTFRDPIKTNLKAHFFGLKVNYLFKVKKEWKTATAKQREVLKKYFNKKDSASIKEISLCFILFEKLKPENKTITIEEVFKIMEKENISGHEIQNRIKLLKKQKVGIFALNLSSRMINLLGNKEKLEETFGERGGVFIDVLDEDPLLAFEMLTTRSKSFKKREKEKAKDYI